MSGSGGSGGGGWSIPVWSGGFGPAVLTPWQLGASAAGSAGGLSGGGRGVILVGYAVGNATAPATPGPNYGQPGGKIGPPAYSPTPVFPPAVLPPYTHVDPNEFQSSSGDSNNWKPYVPPKPSAPAGDDDDDSSDGTSGPPPNFARSPLGPQNYPQPHSDHPEPTEWYPSRRPPGGGKIPGATGPRQPGGPSGGPRILNPPNYPQPHSDHPEPTEWYPSRRPPGGGKIPGATAPPKRSDLPGSSYQPGREYPWSPPLPPGLLGPHDQDEDQD